MLPCGLGSGTPGKTCAYIAAECLRQTNDGQDTDGFRDCLYNLTWSGAIGDSYSFDENGDILGVSHVLVEVLPVSDRTEENLGFRVIGPLPHGRVGQKPPGC